MKFKVIKDCNLDLKNFSKDVKETKLIKASDEIYHVSDEVASKMNLKERFSQFKDYIEIVEVEDVREENKPKTNKGSKTKGNK